MKQKEIKIPLKCKTILRLIGISVVIGINLLFIITFQFNPKIENMIYLNIFLIFFWGMFEFMNYVFNKIDNNEPILPFTFKCKCEDDKD